MYNTLFPITNNSEFSEFQYSKNYTFNPSGEPSSLNTADQLKFTPLKEFCKVRTI